MYTPRRWIYPTSGEYRRAAKIVLRIAKDGYPPYKMIRVFMPDMSKKRLMNFFISDNYNWGERELWAWEKTLKIHDSLTSPMAPAKQKSSSRKRKLLTAADVLAKKAKMAKTIESINQKVEERYGKLTPGKKAFIFDHLFVTAITDSALRHKKLVSIFAGKPDINENTLVNVLFDYVQPRVMAVSYTHLTLPTSP
jgi:hypothetical protein